MHNLNLRHVCILSVSLIMAACSNDDDKNKSPPITTSAPSASDVILTTQTEVSISDMLRATDIDGDTLSYSLSSVTGCLIGSVTLNVVPTPTSLSTSMSPWWR